MIDDSPVGEQCEGIFENSNDAARADTVENKLFMITPIPKIKHPLHKTKQMLHLIGPPLKLKAKFSIKVTS